MYKIPANELSDTETVLSEALNKNEMNIPAIPRTLAPISSTKWASILSDLSTI